MKIQVLKHIISKNTLIFVLLGLIVSSWMPLKIAPSQKVLGINYSITGNQFVDKINTIRRQNGLAPLNLNYKLSQAAMQKANDMVANNYWAHFSPSGRSPWSFIANSNYKYYYAGENLAKGYTNLDAVFNAWMNSESHKRNILSNHFADTGFAMVDGKLGGENSTIIVEMFASPN
jgi:uncharacterized protein YkwD